VKKFWIVIMLVCMLSGCGAQEAFETVNDTLMQPEQAAEKQVMLSLPEDAAAPAMESDTAGKLYLCDGYSVTVQTLESGDLQGTIKETTGFDRAALPIIETVQGEVRRYECVWTTTGETEDQIGRFALLDDGSYHYVVTVMADASKAGQLTNQWNQLFSSFSLTDTAP